MILPTNHDQIDSLISVLNSVLPGTLQIVIRAEHETCEDTHHETITDALRQQRIEMEVAR